MLNVRLLFATGLCTVYRSETEELIITADCMLALSSERSVSVSVQEAARIVAVSVPRDPNLVPKPLLMKTLDDVICSDRNVFFERGYSRRFLASPDGYNVSVHNTLAFANYETNLHFLHNVEGAYIVKGQGEYVWNNGKERHEYNSEKHEGTLILLQHDAFIVKVGAHDVIAICVFFPPLKGSEKLTFDDESVSSY